MSNASVALAWGIDAPDAHCTKWTPAQKRDALLRAPENSHAFGKSDGHGYMRACCLLYPAETGIAGEKLAQSLATQPEHNATGVIGIAMVSRRDARTHC